MDKWYHSKMTIPYNYLSMALITTARIANFSKSFTALESGLNFYRTPVMDLPIESPCVVVAKKFLMFFLTLRLCLKLCF